MKTCSLNAFMEEMKPWLDSDHIRKAERNEHGHFILHFLDGMKNVYNIDDCTEPQVKEVFNELKKKGIPIEM